MSYPVIYRLNISFSREGTLVIESERYRVIEQIDPGYRNYFDKKGTTEVYIDNFENRIRGAKRRNEVPIRHQEWILIEKDILEDKMPK